MCPVGYGMSQGQGLYLNLSLLAFKQAYTSLVTQRSVLYRVELAD